MSDQPRVIASRHSAESVRKTARTSPACNCSLTVNCWPSGSFTFISTFVWPSVCNLSIVSVIALKEVSDFCRRTRRSVPRWASCEERIKNSVGGLVGLSRLFSRSKCFGGLAIRGRKIPGRRSQDHARNRNSSGCRERRCNRHGLLRHGFLWRGGHSGVLPSNVCARDLFVSRLRSAVSRKTTMNFSKRLLDLVMFAASGRKFLPV
mgnify:CR=1 FL=1